jgi:hypothetical protein
VPHGKERADDAFKLGWLFGQQRLDRLRQLITHSRFGHTSTPTVLIGAPKDASSDPAFGRWGRGHATGASPKVNTMIGTGPIFSAAAAERTTREQQEEEVLTDYTPQDIAEDWEFKILRASVPVFASPRHLQHILAEEARAGWVLVEKFDDHRIRLKRPAKARDGDGKLDFDAYRTSVGIPGPRLTSSQLTLITVIALPILFLLIIVLFMWIGTGFMDR